MRNILKEAIELAGVPISDRDFIRYFNRAVESLAMQYDTAKARTSQTIVCTDVKDEYDLTVGTMKIERVAYNDCYTKNFMVLGNSKITFYHTGTFVVEAMFLPPAVNSFVDEFPINTAFVTAVKKYVASKACAKSDPDLSKELMNEFTTDGAMANKNIRKANNPNRRIAVRPFR